MQIQENPSPTRPLVGAEKVNIEKVFEAKPSVLKELEDLTVYKSRH
jgi:hypothetical protein